MMNTLTDLNNYLFAQIEKLTDEDLTDEELQKEITRTRAITGVAETIIHNGELSLAAAKHMAEYAIDGYQTVPPMLEARR